MRWDKLDKAKYRRVLRRVQLLKTWQLVVLLFLGVLLSATFLRLNSLEMIERREAVKVADAKGDKTAIQTSVVDLQHYVSRHMNTSLGDGFPLEHSYNRDRDAALASANQATNPNSSVYQQASIECRSRFQGGTSSFQNDYVQCVIDQVSALSPQTDIESTLNLPKADAYKINFSSPLWTPDLAGISVAFCLAVTLVIVGRLLLVGVLRLMLQNHYRSI